MPKLPAISMTIQRHCRLVLPAALLSWALTDDVRAQDQTDFAALFAHSVPLTASGAGSYSVVGILGGIEVEFLLDTGASLVTVSSTLFARIHERGSAVKIRRVGARLASGKVEAMDVYQVDRLQLGENCELGPVEVAVLKRGGRNLLGMNALQQAAPFAISTTPPELGLSNCGYALQQVSLLD